eukprot:3406679-Pleurochrysis_carterae.AAC.3
MRPHCRNKTSRSVAAHTCAYSLSCQYHCRCCPRRLSRRPSPATRTTLPWRRAFEWWAARPAQDR